MIRRIVIAIASLLLSTALSGCSAPPPAEEVLEPLAELAEKISVFPVTAGSFRRVQWDFGARSITAHYVRDERRDEAQNAELPNTAWVSRFICQPEEQDPFAYAGSKRLIAGLKASHPTVETLDVSEEQLADHTFTVVFFAIPGDVGSEIGVIAATVLEPVNDKYHVLLARASRREVSGPILFPGLSWLADLLTPVLE